jgi:PhnB protein
LRNAGGWRVYRDLNSWSTIVKAFQPYLNFDGNTREAMTFYHNALGGNLSIQSFGDVDPSTPDAMKNRVMHARLDNGSAVLMASDTMPEHKFVQGTNVHVNVDCATVEEIERYFKAMSESAQITMPLADQFWGARFGMLTDKFGVNWMFNCELKR